MRAEGMIERASDVVELVKSTSLAQDVIEAVLEVGEEIPVAGKLVELIHKFYSAAKGAQTNQAECEAFARQVKR